MPEMPGVMTDILISMDDRLRLIRIGKKSGLGLAKKIGCDLYELIEVS